MTSLQYYDSLLLQTNKIHRRYSVKASILSSSQSQYRVLFEVHDVSILQKKYK